MALIVTTVLAGELGLQIAARVWHKADLLTRHDCPDPFVHDRQGSINYGNSSCLDHDARGYRNREALKQADIVALGDSFTYGTGALESAWVPILGNRLQEAVYNMGLPGTGPLLNLQHLSQALDLHPKVIIFGFYFGNDLFDDFEYAELHGLLPKYTEPDVFAEITKAEQTEPLKTKAGTLFQNGLQGQASKFARIRSFLGNYSRLFELLRSVKNNLVPLAGQDRITTILEPRYEDAVSAILESERRYVAPFAADGWKTIFTPPYRLAALDLSDVPFGPD